MPRVVNCILLSDEGKILILKRSNKVKTYKYCWGGVAGYIEEGEEPIDTAFKEIHEEVGLDKHEVSLTKKGDPIEFTDVYDEETYYWKVYPFLFKTSKKGKIQIDWEHSEYRWITPSDISKFDTVPHLKDVVLSLLV